MLHETRSRIREYFQFSNREKREVLISILIFGFILSFRFWGDKHFELSEGLANWLFASISVFVVMILNISTQKIFALNRGFQMYYHWWFQGIVMGLFLTFIFYGVIPFVYPGVAYFKHKKGLRLGKWRHGSNIKDMAIASVSGVVMNVLIALIFSFIYMATNNKYVLFFIMINFAYAFFCMLPLPRIEGVKFGEGATAGFYIFFFARWLYVLVFVALLAYSILIYMSITYFGSLILLTLSLVIGLIAMYFFIKNYH